MRSEEAWSWGLDITRRGGCAREAEGIYRQNLAGDPGTWTGTQLFFNLSACAFRPYNALGL